ncbi:MAG TPA: hypothetical protein VK112_01460 [Fodinibius sp.]|nr:hypothetical protein [Fodinibius sp.]
MNISTFRAYCEACDQSFPTPLLSDFSYGAFLYHSTDGQSVRYFEASGHPIFKQVEVAVEQKYGSAADQTRGTIIHALIGRLADRPSDAVHFTTDIICPNCGEKAQQVDPNKKTGSQEVEPLQFENFRALTALQQEKRIQTILANITHDHS